jgi:hypothetical protein
MINQDISSLFRRWRRKQVAREGARDGTLRPRFMMVGTLDALRGMVRLCTDHCSRQNTTKRVFSTVKTHEYLVRQVSLGERLSDKALRVSSLDYGSSSLHEYSLLQL